LMPGGRTSRGSVSMLKLETRADLEGLITQGAQESLTLDYKQADALAKDDKKRNELCKDVSAFANFAGGQMVCGIVEKRSPPRPSPRQGRGRCQRHHPGMDRAGQTFQRSAENRGSSDQADRGRSRSVGIRHHNPRSDDERAPYGPRQQVLLPPEFSVSADGGLPGPGHHAARHDAGALRASVFLGRQGRVTRISP
jgi:Putative DNA-binding domain